MPDFFVRKRNISNFATTWLIRRSYPLFITLFWRLCSSLQMYDNMWRKNGRFFAAKMGHDGDDISLLVKTEYGMAKE